MRLGRLNLIRYGHFSDCCFDLPPGRADLHIIFGPNEAGKSTTLAAIEDLLFSVSERSPYGFLHGNQNMRIGAVLETEGSTLEVVRRKGRKETLLDSEGAPLVGGEALLKPFLAGADQSFFQRMFSLDHQRLRSGGQEILEAKDDVGQMLFAAGSGIAGLRPLLAALSDEADGLWAPRRAEKRRFYLVDDKRKTADANLREQTLTASRWQELKRSRDEAEAAYRRINDEIKAKTVERNRLGRIRRVFRSVRRLEELDSDLAALGDVVELPEDATRTLAETEREDSLAATRKSTLQDQLIEAEASLQALTFDETLVRHADQVRELAERAIEVRSGRLDLPRRQAELVNAEKELKADARELGWMELDAGALADKVPARSRVRVVRELLGRRGKLETAVETHRDHLEEADQKRDTLSRRLQEAEFPLEVSRLATTIKVLREKGDLAGRLRSAGKVLKMAEDRVARRLETLDPLVAEEAHLVTMRLPVSAEVEAFRDREQDWKRRLQEAKKQILSCKQERDAAAAAVEQRVRDEQLVTPEDLAQARERRNRLWSMVKIKQLEGRAIPEAVSRGLEAALPDPASAFEPAMETADALADRRFDQAEAAGQLAEIRRKIGELESQLTQAMERESHLVEAGKALQSEWAEMWRAALVKPIAAEAMLKWLGDRAQLLEEIETREAAQIEWASLKQEEQDAKEVLLTELAAVSFDILGLGNDSLPLIIERAAEAQAGEEAKASQRADIEKDLAEAASEAAQQERRLERASADLETWRRERSVALADLGLAADLALDAIEPSLDLIEELRETAGKIRALRHDRIDKIKRDLAGFDLAVEQLVGHIAKDLTELTAEEAVSRLVMRLDDAEAVRKQRRQTSKRIEELKSQVEAIDQEQSERAASLSHLMALAGASNAAGLKEAIAKSDRKRTSVGQRLETIATLRQDGDGKAPEELAAECAEVEFDAISAKTASIDMELATLSEQERAAIEVLTQARQDFQTIGGDDAAARAAADKEAALAEMQEVAQRYVRVKTSAILLQWAIDRYRREKQAPLLKRASVLFAIMTGDSFAGLEVAYDEQDRAELRGLRSDGSQIALSGMSSGTADQLYLALRVAAIEDYLQRAEALPFVADDLFINFDDARAAAGLRIMQGLSRETQVLFFTHHQHLVDLAHKTLEGSINLVTLSDGQELPT